MADGNARDRDEQLRAQSVGEGYIRVYNKDIYNLLIDVRDRVAKLEDRVDNVLGENVDLRRSVRALELKFYSVGAGLVMAIVVMFKVGLKPL